LPQFFDRRRTDGRCDPTLAGFFAISLPRHENIQGRFPSNAHRDSMDEAGTFPARKVRLLNRRWLTIYLSQLSLKNVVQSIVRNGDRENIQQ
jgi:hypothetical protein